jgi:two-component system, LytTR family, response regulator
MNVIIIEDEDKIRAGMVRLCKLYLPDLHILTTVGSLEEGIVAIKEFEPELIFLDINLNGESGFDLLKAFPERNFQVIFVTAHEEFALQAIKKEALDYLLKPIDPEDLIIAENKAKKRAPKVIRSKNDKLVLKDSETIKAVPFEEILYIKADGAYTEIHTSTEMHLSSKNLKHFENLLKELPFLRVHQSFLGHMRHFDRYDKTMNQLIIKTSPTPIPVSARMREKLYDFLKTGLI